MVSHVEPVEWAGFFVSERVISKLHPAKWSRFRVAGRLIRWSKGSKMANGKSFKMRFWAPGIVVVFGLGWFGYFQWHRYQEHQTQLKKELEAKMAAIRERFERYGDGRYLKVLSTMPPEKIETLVEKVGEDKCGEFVSVVTGGNLEENYSLRNKKRELALGLRPSVLEACAKRPPVSGEEVWEGLKEINSLVASYGKARGEYYSEMGTLNLFSSSGHFQRVEESAGDDPKQLETAKNADDEEREDIYRRLMADGEQMHTIEQQMEQVAALVLSRVPEAERDDLLTAMETLSGNSPTE